MSIDMTGLARLGSVGLAKVLTEIPKGNAKEGIQFAFKIKKAAWNEGKYGYRYHLDVVVRSLDMQVVLGAMLWKLYPSMLPADVIEAIDCDTYDDTWWLVRTEVNAKSKADPPRTLLHLIDTQEGIGMQESGPSKPADSSELLRLGERQQRGVHATPTEAGSERGQPGAGGEPASQQEPPAAPCPHTAVRLIENEQGETEGFQCKACGERVG